MPKTVNTKKPEPLAPQIRLVLASTFIIYLCQMALGPVVAPLSRELKMPEWQLGTVISLAAIMVVLTSQMWGTLSQRIGPKRVLTTSFTVATVATAGFVAFVILGRTGLIVGASIFILFVLLRGILFGLAIAAVGPTAQTLIAGVTNTEKDRIRGMAGIGAVQGMSMVFGVIIGGALAAINLLATIIFVPVLLAAGLYLITHFLKPAHASTLIEQPAKVSPLDSRVLPYLIAGFAMFTALGFIQIDIGFYVIDRLHLDNNTSLAGTLTAVPLIGAAVCNLLSQAVIVPRLHWSPPKLIRVGIAIMFLGFIMLLPDLGLISITASSALIGLGMGFGTPGYIAGPTLHAKREEHGAVTGLIGATNGLTFVVAPILGTVFYKFAPLLPVFFALTILVAVFVFVFLHPRFNKKTFTANPANN